MKKPDQKPETKHYRHYKNKDYRYLGTAKHSEDLSDYVIYECLYKNEVSQIWIRPKIMFHEDLNINNDIKPRFKKIEYTIKIFDKIDQNLEKEIFPLCEKNFSHFSPEKFRAKLHNKDHILLLCAYENENLIGFKLGYELDILRFYSWLGAVEEKYRGLGIAKLLMHEQHKWALNRKYKFIETKSENHFKSMIALNLFSGFEIIGTENSHSGQFKILFRKKL